jgi:hypothetical protein
MSRVNTSPLMLVAALAFIGLATPARAAQVTDVADAIDGEDPFDANLELRVEYTFHRALITRENLQPPEAGGAARTLHVRELEYMRHTARLRPRLEIGLFHDLAVFAEWPLPAWDQQSWGFASGTSAENSTLARDMRSPPVVDNWTEPGTSYGIPGTERDQGHTEWNLDLAQNGEFQKTRSGIDYPILGVRWSPVNNERDDTKPAITLQFDYKPAFLLPVMQDEDDLPAQQLSTFAADATHRLHFAFAFSKRFLILDPYFLADYTFPFANSDAVLGLEPRHDGGFRLGIEIVPYENPTLDQKFIVDLSVMTRYFSPGRDYSEVSDVLNELTWTDEWIRAGAQGALVFRAWKFVSFDLTAGAFYDTPHYVTTEVVGCDGGCSSPGLLARTVDAFNPNKALDGNIQVRDTAERNPYYNPVIDTPGRRLRVDESFFFTVVAHAMVTF